MVPRSKASVAASIMLDAFRRKAGVEGVVTMEGEE